MKNPLWRIGERVVLSVAVLVIASGCGGTGETMYLDVIPKVQPGPRVEAQPVKIVIEPFEDRRVDRNHVGLRTHLWGGVTYFNVAGEKPGEIYAQALAERLQTKGWQDRSWNVRVAPASSITDADIVISGQIFEFSGNAKSKPFSTYVTASSKLTITARNNVDRSATSRSLEGDQSDTVFWFGDEDVQRLLTSTIKDTIDRYVTDTTISQRALRPNR